MNWEFDKLFISKISFLPEIVAKIILICGISEKKKLWVQKLICHAIKGVYTNKREIKEEQIIKRKVNIMEKRVFNNVLLVIYMLTFSRTTKNYLLWFYWYSIIFFIYRFFLLLLFSLQTNERFFFISFLKLTVNSEIKKGRKIKISTWISFHIVC